MVLVEVLHQSTTSPLRQTATAPSPISPSSQLNKSVVSEESFDHRQEALPALSTSEPQPKPSTIWRRSFSDSFIPDGIFELPLQHDTTVKFETLYKRKKMVSGATNNYRSLSWCADEEVSTNELLSWISTPSSNCSIQRGYCIDVFSSGATKTGLGLSQRSTDLCLPLIDQPLGTNRRGGQSLHLVTKSQGRQGKMHAIRPFEAYSSTTNQSAAVKEDLEQKTVNDVPCQLAHAVLGMRIAQIEGYSEIYQAMQISPSILSHSGVFCKTFQYFHRQGVSCKVDVGYRYFVNEKEYFPEQGLLPGVTTFNEPFAFYPHDSIGIIQGQLVARVPGNLLKVSTTISHLKPSEAATYTAVEMPLRRSFVQILSSADQCLPLLNFDPLTVLDLYDNESMGNLVLHTYHQRLQKELDRLFNDGVLTKVPFHLPSEHPDFQPI